MAGFRLGLSFFFCAAQTTLRLGVLDLRVYFFLGTAFLRLWLLTFGICKRLTVSGIFVGFFMGSLFCRRKRQRFDHETFESPYRHGRRPVARLGAPSPLFAASPPRAGPCRFGTGALKLPLPLEIIRQPIFSWVGCGCEAWVKTRASSCIILTDSACRRMKNNA